MCIYILWKIIHIFQPNINSKYAFWFRKALYAQKSGQPPWLPAPKKTCYTGKETVIDVPFPGWELISVRPPMY